MSQESDTLQDGGGRVRIVTAPIDVARVIASVAGPESGAISVFLGTVREESLGQRVLFLEYEAYLPMAEHELRAIVRLLPVEFGPSRVAIEHRLGRLEIGETSVAIAVASPHRRVAIAACAEAIERVKKTVPIWKKEHFEGGAVWIEGDARSPAVRGGVVAGGGGRDRD